MLHAVPKQPKAQEPGNSDWLREISVVKLHVTQHPWDSFQPWDREYTEEAIGSGFLHDGRILTNAHVVSDASFIEIELPTSQVRIEGVVESVNHQVDLALLRPATDELDDLAPLALGSLPAHLDEVITIGYPIGGREVSYTAGIVSRVDILHYAHSQINGLLVQTDAAINPGNSGGPVVSRRTRKCVGIASQGFDDGEGLGYFIPTPIIEQFLKDVDSKPLGGIANLGCFLQPLQNPAHREFLGAPKGQGVRISRIASGSSADGILEPDDVILALDGTKVSMDGRVRTGSHGSVSLSYKLARKQIGEKVTVDILRGRKPKTVTIELKPFCSTIIPEVPLYDQQPRYFIEAGFVFIAVDERYVHFLESSDDMWDSVSAYQSKLVGESDLKELVVISRVLNSSINKGYSGSVENSRVVSVNGKAIRDLNGLIRQLRKAKAEDFIRLRLESSFEILLRTADLEKANESIRKRYKVDE